MNKLYGDVVLVVGASSGMGKAIAEALASEDYKVYGTSRKAEMPKEQDEIAAAQSGGFLKMLQLDVCSQESIERAVNFIKEKEGGIDILVNCPGFALAGSVEDTSFEEAFMEFNTNFFGIHRVCRSVLPVMREKSKGLIINISSTAGLIPVPFQSFYSASKFALEAMTEGMRSEVKPFGINVAMVEPGDTKTGFTNSRVFVKDSKDSAYKNVFDSSIERMIKDEQSGPPPVGVVKTVMRMINSSNPPVRVVVGPINKVLAFLKRVLPSRLVVYIVSKLYA
ncbi:MAG: short-chain dehydrogenase/reductase [Clostridia bacterium]|nr:short-chain dehydrogenase/reductase [Clostridia bacterium]